MDPKFWHNRWNKNEIGFHEESGNKQLKQYFKRLNLQEGDTVFVPLCGKTQDIAWFLLHGLNVIAVELNEDAVKQLFDTLKVKPKVESHGTISVYSAENLCVYVCNFFDLELDFIGQINAVYDRAALVALPEKMRSDYVQHLLEITNKAAQLLITFRYDQNLLEGPPFSIEQSKLDEYYAKHFNIKHLHSEKVKGGIRELEEAFEDVYLLN